MVDFTQHFKVGDRVRFSRWKGLDEDYHNKKGTVVEVHSYEVHVLIDGKQTPERSTRLESFVVGGSSMKSVDTLKEGVSAGIKQVTYDQVGEVLLDLAIKIFGAEHPILQSKEGREFVKVGISFALTLVGDALPIPVEQKMLEKICETQTQTAVFKLLGPHMQALADAAKKLI